MALVDRWRAGGIDWLEELYQLSMLYPDPELSRLNQLSASVKVNNAVINVKGVLHDQQTLAELNQRLMQRPYDDVDIVRHLATSNPDFGVAIDQNIMLPLVDVESIGMPPAPVETGDPQKPADELNRPETGGAKEQP